MVSQFIRIFGLERPSPIYAFKNNYRVIVYPAEAFHFAGLIILKTLSSTNNGKSINHGINSAFYRVLCLRVAMQPKNTEKAIAYLHHSSLRRLISREECEGCSFTSFLYFLSGILIFPDTSTLVSMMVSQFIRIFGLERPSPI